MVKYRVKVLERPNRLLKEKQPVKPIVVWVDVTRYVADIYQLCTHRQIVIA